VPIRDRSGEVVASLSFAVMPEELTEANLRKWVPQLLQASARLSQLMRSGAGPVV
jgi:DNA-binding IclR family transcriptional regulator